MSELSVVLLDNVDSFTYNLVDEFARRGQSVTVFRNDVPAERVLAEALRRPRTLLVISPGPGDPAGAGSCLGVVRGALGRVPLFGVCLGHQALVAAAGGRVVRAPEPLHGKATAVVHDGGQPFGGLPSPMPVGRYHSLAAGSVPDALEVTARAGDVVMAVRHRTAPALGIQFHPESVLTPAGGALIDNVISWATHAGR
ncbi:MAG: aminodeoxychorismate/anthranilate synthase component II [Gemmatimonadales bacterium]